MYWKMPQRSLFGRIQDAIFASEIYWPLIKDEYVLELVSKELNHLAAILHVYARGLNFMK